MSVSSVSSFGDKRILLASSAELALSWLKRHFGLPLRRFGACPLVKAATALVPVVCTRHVSVARARFFEPLKVISLVPVLHDAVALCRSPLYAASAYCCCPRSAVFCCRLRCLLESMPALRKTMQ